MKPSLKDVEAALGRIKGVAYHTPVLHSDELDELTGKQIYLKCENLQRSGSFKFRGAYNRLSQFTPAERQHGVVAFSSGNHGKAIALAAHLLEIPAVVVVQDIIPQLKEDGIRKYEAEVIKYNSATEDREVISKHLAEERGMVLVPPYDDYDVMAGQGTATYELIKETPDLDAILVPVGGGGMIAGNAVAAKGLKPSVKVVGVEPKVANKAALSLKKGTRAHIPDPEGKTIVNAILTLSLGETTWPVIQKTVDDVILVNDKEVLDALRFSLEELKLVIEPASATVLAAAYQLPKSIKKVGLILTGGNYSLESLHELLG